MIGSQFFMIKKESWY